MEQGNIAKWYVQPGQPFSAGDVLADIETDKATMAWESQEDGVMAKILSPEGSKDIPIGTVVALSVEEESELSEAEGYAPGGGGGGGQPSAAEPPGGSDEASSSAGGGGGKMFPRGGKMFPPHQVWTMPALSPTMASGSVAKWYKQVGDSVAAGDGMVEVETDKATMMWESVEDGFVAKILAPDGTQDLAVGEPVVVIVEDESTVPAFSSFTMEDAKGGGGEPKDTAQPGKEAKDGVEGKAPEGRALEDPAIAGDAPGSQLAGGDASPAGVTGPPRAGAPSGRSPSSPYARRLARELGVDMAGLEGSGPGGRIVAGDIERAKASGGVDAAPAAAASAPEQAAAFTDEKASQIRRVVARRLLESKTTVPHYYLSIDCSVTKLAGMRAALNERLAGGGQKGPDAPPPPKVSVNDFVIKAAAAALRAVPEVNASWHGDFIRRYHNVDVTVAVQTAAGLMVPVVRDADIKGLSQIAAEVKELAGKAKAGKLGPEDSSGGTFAVSNLGMFGVKSFSAVINPPQAAILACGGTERRVVLGAGGSPQEVDYMTVTLSCDHRVVDGAVGAAWLQAFKGFVEQPETLLL